MNHHLHLPAVGGRCSVLRVTFIVALSALIASNIVKIMASLAEIEVKIFNSNYKSYNCHLKSVASAYCR